MNDLEYRPYPDELYGYPRHSRRNALRDDVLLVDHISFAMSSRENQNYFDWLNSNIHTTNENGKWVKPHMTIAYSYTRIDDFPNIDFEGEESIYLPYTQKLIIPTGGYGKYELFTDPVLKRTSLILPIDINLVQRIHDYYLSKGGVWDSDRLGKYRPFIFIEHDTQYESTRLGELPYPDYDLVFDMLRFMRFAESID